MTNRRRYLISAAVLAACVCAAWAVLAMLPPRPGVTKANFDRIEIGMTRADVRPLFGDPSAACELGASWLHDDGSQVYVRFDDDDKAIEKEFRPSTETFTDKLRRWLHLPE